MRPFMLELPPLSQNRVPQRAATRVAQVGVDVGAVEAAWGGRHTAQGWAWRAGCGLEVGLEQDGAGAWWLWTEERAELEHALAHLPFEVGLRWSAPEALREGWVVSRLDSTGIRFDIATLRRATSAHCYAERLEARRHKQSYSVEQRGEVPPPPPHPAPDAPFTLLRQDDNGQVFEVLRGSRDVVEALAARLSAEPRHKQLYFVTPASSSHSASAAARDTSVSTSMNSSGV